MTKAEAILWNHIKQKQICDQRFLRQFSIDIYIIDFYCPKLKLAIEVDGDTHLTEDEMKYDKKRQDKLETFDVRFLRFTNGEIYNGLNHVIENIENKVNEMLKNEKPPCPP
jgi:very-short-patch-repair endonuclease